LADGHLGDVGGENGEARQVRPPPW
jgi:hypothetical protein